MWPSPSFSPLRPRSAREASTARTPSTACPGAWFADAAPGELDLLLARRDLAGASEPLEGRARSLLKMAARPAGCGNAGRPPDAGGERRPQALNRNYNSAPSSDTA